MRLYLKIIVATAWMLLLIVSAYAQVIDANRCTRDNHLIITKYVQFLKTTKVLPLDSVLTTGQQKKFKLLPDRAVIFQGYDPYRYWLRFAIRNTDTAVTHLMLLMGPIGMRDALLYQKINQRWTIVSRTGNQYPFEDRPYLYTHDVLPLNISPVTIDTFYIKMDERGNFKTFSFALLQPKALKLVGNRVYFSFGIIVGLLLLFALFNTYLFFSIREKIHLWYALYILLLIFLLMKNEGLDEQFLHLDSETGYRLTPIMSVGALAISTLIHVVQLFLVNIPKRSALFRVTSFVKFSLFVFAAAHLIIFYFRPGYKIENLVFQIADKSTVAGVLIILANCVYSITKGFKPGLFILAGMLVFLIGSLERLLVISTATYMFPPSIFQIGMVIETTIISFGLMFRYNKFKQEKEELALQLEKQKVEASRQIILTQEIEQKRIATDLHDELGGNLAAIKMTLQNFDLPNKQLKIITKLIDNASDNARHIAHNLMPPEFENTSLDDLLKNYYQQLSGENNCRFHFYSSGNNHPLDKQHELMIYRIIMELSNNILKHAEASEATLQLVYYEKYLELMAEDNGAGFIEKAGDGIGIKNIRSRLDYLKGTINIDSGKTGTTIIIQIPYQ